MDQWAKNAQKNLANVNSMLQRFGFLATSAFTLPLVAAGKSMYNAAKDFEYTTQKIVGLTATTVEQMTEYKKAILDLAPAVGKGPKELADALYYIASAGIHGAEAMDVLRLSAKAAASGLGETMDVSNLLTSVLNAYRGTGLTAAKATDQLVQAVLEGKIQADSFANAIGQVIPIASQLGVSFGQVAGAMAAISLTGSSASQAAVYFKGILNALLKETDQGKQALDSMKTSYAELRQILREKGTIPLLQKVRDLSLEYGDTLAKDVFPNIRALTGYLSIAGKNFQYNADMMKRVENASGALNKAYEAISGTIQQRHNKAVAAAQVALISLGNSFSKAFIPVLEWAAKVLTNLAHWFDNLSDRTKKLIFVFGGLLAAMGPISLILSGIVWVLRFFIGIVSTTIKVINNLVMAFRTIGTASSFAAGPVGLLIATLTALGIAIVTVIRRHNELDRALKAATAQYNVEKFSIDQVFNVLKSTTSSTKERANAIKYLNDNYGEYLGNLLSEKTKLEDIEKLQDRVNAGVVLNFQLKANADQLDKLTKKASNSYKNQIGAINDMLFEVNKAGYDKYSKFLSVAIKNSIRDQGEVDKRLAEWYAGEIYDAYIAPSEKLAKEQNKWRSIKFSKTHFKNDFVDYLEKLAPEQFLKEKVMTLTSLLKNIKSVQDDLEDLGEVKIPGFENKDVETINPTIVALWKEFDRAEKKLLNEESAFKKLGIVTSFAGDKMTLYTDYLKQLLVYLKPTDKAIQQLASSLKAAQAQQTAEAGALKDVKDNVKNVKDIFVDFKSKVEEINFQDKFKFDPSFDKNLAMLDLYKDKAIEIIQVMSELKGNKDLQKAMGAQEVAKSLYLLSIVLSQVTGEIHKYKTITDDIADQNALNLLRAEADVFGTIDAKAELVNAQLQNIHRRLKSLASSKMKSTEGIFSGFLDLKTIDDEIRRLLVLMSKFDLELVSLQNENAVKFAKGMADSIGSWSNKLEVVNVEITKTKALLEALANQPNGMETKEWDNLINKLQRLENEYANLSNTAKMNELNDIFRLQPNLQNGMAIVTEKMEELRETLKKMSDQGLGKEPLFKEYFKDLKQLEAATKIADILTQSFEDFFISISSGFEDFGKSILNMIRNLVAKLLAEFLVFQILKKLFSTAFNGMSFIQFLGAQNNIEVPGNAKGGIVPPGYPNDTYLTRLSSAEAIIPLSKIRNYIKPVTAVEGKVRFEIEGDKLIGILEKQGYKNSVI